MCPSSDDLSCEGFRYRLADEGAAITGYEGDIQTLTIPDVLAGHVVVAIDPLAFAGHSEIVSLALPHMVGTVGARAFEACSSLAHLTLSPALERLDASAFSRCGDLSDVVIPSGMTRIPIGVFADSPVRRLVIGRDVCEMDLTVPSWQGLQELTVDPGNVHFSTDGIALLDHDGTVLLRMLVHRSAYAVPRGCRKIAYKAFDSIEELDRIVLPQTLEAIGRFSFAKTGLVRVEIPDSVHSIGERAFYYCSSLEDVTFPEGLVSIGASAFERTGLTRVHLPSTLVELGQDAFQRTSLVPIQVPPAITIDERNPIMHLDGPGGLYALRDGEWVLERFFGKAASYTVAPDTKVVGERAFFGNVTMEKVTLPAGLHTIGASAFDGCCDLCEIDLPDSLETLSEKALRGTALVRLRIPRHLESIGHKALTIPGEFRIEQRPTLEQIQVDPGNTHFRVEGGMLLRRSEQGETLIGFSGPNRNLDIPEGVTGIEAFAFCGNTWIEEISFPTTLSWVSPNAFSRIDHLRKVTIRYAQPIEGQSIVVLPFSQNAAYGISGSQVFSFDDDGAFFRYRIYDQRTMYAEDLAFRASVAVTRLLHPIKLNDGERRMYLRLLTIRTPEICHSLALKGDLATIEGMARLGMFGRDTIDGVLERCISADSATVNAFLLEFKSRTFGVSPEDFEL